MSEEINLLSREEAALLAGVCIETIERYRDLGLLRKYQKDSEERFSEEDIKLLFNARIRNRTKTDVSTGKSRIFSTPPVVESPSNYQEQPKSVTGGAEEELPRLQDILKEVETSSPESAGETSMRSSNETEYDIDESAFDEGRSIHQYSRAGTYPDISSIELLELTKTLKDQLEIVKEERNWLRKRIEKLESQTERDQMLRMAESETIRTLISQKENRKNPWSFLLSWTKPKTETSNNKIENQQK